MFYIVTILFKKTPTKKAMKAATLPMRKVSRAARKIFLPVTFPRTAPTLKKTIPVKVIAMTNFHSLKVGEKGAITNEKSGTKPITIKAIKVAVAVLSGVFLV